MRLSTSIKELAENTTSYRRATATVQPAKRLLKKISKIWQNSAGFAARRSAGYLGEHIGMPIGLSANMRSFLPGILSAGLLLLPGQADAQFGVRVARLKVTSERRAPRLTGSEPMLAGVMSGNLASPISRARIYVFGLRPTDRTLCVRVQSMDGVYEVTMEAALEGGAVSPDGTQIDFARDVRYPQIAVGRPGAEFAIRVQAVGEKGNCAAGGDLLVASWQPVRPTSVAMSFLSGSGSAALFPAPGQRQNCPGIAEFGPVTGQRTTFDRICQIPVPACGGTVSYPIRRVNSSGSSLGTINARFRSPC